MINFILWCGIIATLAGVVLAMIHHEAPAYAYIILGGLIVFGVGAISAANAP